MTKKLQQWFILLIPISLVFSIFAADLLVLITSVIFLISQIVNKKYKIFLNKYFVFFFIFWIYLILNSILSYDVELSLSRSIPYIRFGLFFILLGYYLYDTDFRNRFFNFVILILFIICIDGIFQYFFGYNLLGYESKHVSRISSFFYEELVLGRYLLSFYPLFLISLYYLKNNKIISNLFVQIILLSLYSFTIYLSGERTAFFNYLLFNLILLFIFFNKNNLKKLVIFTAIFSFLVLISTIFNKNTFERYLTIKNIFQTDKIVTFTKFHEKHYLTAYKIFEANKLFGSGIKTFRHICKKPEYKPEGCATHPHNIFMQFLSELGLIGLFFYVFAFIYFVSRLLKLFIRKVTNKVYKNEIYAESILVVAIIVTLWPFSPSGNFFNNWLSILSILPLGLLVFFENKKSKS
ncbi:MAG: hypothetical protein CMF54_07305 [Legionellales bacterium]|nr:hypothetical protein [Legionellales bacterium]|tara:strand:+ start:4584 stop:5807 length:1224 start_codon:yes stop_codon:yes gene_type:complete